MESRKHDYLSMAIVAITASILLAIAIPNFLISWNRERQKRSMADMRSIATALEARASELNTYAIGSTGASLTPVSLANVEHALSPRYIRKLPLHDGWDNEFEILISAGNYEIRSRGSNGRAEASTYTQRVIKSFKEDLVFRNGNFVWYPEGSCSL